MNLKNITITFMIVIVYTVLNKLGHSFAPVLFESSGVASITKILSLLSRIVVFVFLILFFLDQTPYRSLKNWFKALIACYLVTLLLHLPFVIKVLGPMDSRFLGLGFGFIDSFLFFIVLILYKKQIPDVESTFIKSANFLTIVLGLQILKALMVLIEFGRYYFTGFMTEHSPVFYQVMLVYFLISQGVFFWFLYRFCLYRFKA